MKDISNIKIKDIDYAVGLDWEVIEDVSKKDLDNQLNAKAKAKNKDYGCIIKKDDGVIEVGFAKQNVKGLTSIAAIIAKELKEVLFIKKINNVDNWICNLDSRGLVIDGKEGIFSDKDLLELIDDLELLGKISIVCSKKDHDTLFDSGFEHINFTHIDLEDIIERNKRTLDDSINLIIRKSTLKKNLITLIILSTVLGAASYYVFTDSQEYLDIVNQEMSAPLEAKDKKFKKMVKENQEQLAIKMSMNAGKKMLLEKINSDIYSKKEIYTHIKELYEVYPLYFYEWQLESIQYIKSDDNRDVKFSVVYKRIENSIGFYNEIREKTLELANKSFQTHNVMAYPGDLGNNIIIVDHYFKKPLELKQNASEQEQLEKLEKDIKNSERDIKRLRDYIGEVEFRISNELGFIDKKFGSSVQEAASEIEANVTKASKIYDDIMKKYSKQEQGDINVPEKYLNGKKSDFLNLSQQNSFYQWRDDKQPLLLPPAPTEKSKQSTYNAFVKVWKFNMNSQDYSTQGVAAIDRAVDVLNRTDISIYNVNYRIENESWYIKGELYEKN
jgi:hypothetical protein